jgi:hypothetical protein
MSSVRDIHSRSPFVARQLGWLDLLEAGLHVVGIVVRTVRVRVAPLISDKYQLSLTPTSFILQTPLTIWYHVLRPLRDYNASEFFKIVGIIRSLSIIVLILASISLFSITLSTHVVLSLNMHHPFSLSFYACENYWCMHSLV